MHTEQCSSNVYLTETLTKVETMKVLFEIVKLSETTYQVWDLSKNCPVLHNYSSLKAATKKTESITKKYNK